MSESLIPSGESQSQSQSETASQGESTSQSESQSATESQANYYFADGVAGNGDAPDWFKGDKYANVSEQAKAYTELEKKFGSFTGAPKDGYAIEGVDFSEANPLMQLVGEWGAENSLSQNGMESLYNKVTELAERQIQDERDGHMKALGENAEQRLRDLGMWGENNFQGDELEAFKSVASTAQGVEVMEKLISKAKNSKLVEAPATQNSQENMEKSFRDRQMATDKDGNRMMNNSEYRKQLEKDMKDYYAKNK